MTEHILKTHVAPPDGWEYAGEFRPANDEWFLHGKSNYRGTTDYPVVILRRARWVPKPGEIVWRVNAIGEVYEMRHESYMPIWAAFKTKALALKFYAEMIALAERIRAESEVE